MTTMNTTQAPASEAAPASAEPMRTGPVFRPAVDILETRDEVLVLADMPGVAAGGVDIDFEDGVLTVHGRVGPREAGGKPLLREYGVGDFERTFQIGQSIDASSISAELSGGVLTVTMPKSAASRPRKIQVQAKP
ncbi:MAG: Hsp20/alpha crystallin family protein [Phycisphaeraceae bacterium]|nr:Hsp20/alpha crystallin family protein [Phycisphaeraceae bacterium]